jgi:hypothetical protein
VHNWLVLSRSAKAGRERAGRVLGTARAQFKEAFPMKKIDLASVPAETDCNYPYPFNLPCSRQS